MSQSIEKALYRTVTSIFEEVTFLVADLELSEEQAGAPPEAEAWLSFRGPVHGAVQVRVCGELLPLISTNLLGLGDAPEWGLQLDALGELTNMICGSMLPVLAPGQDFQQSPPQVSATAASAALAVPPVARARIGLEGGRAEVALYVQLNPFEEAA